MKKLGWEGHGLGKDNQGVLQFEEIKDKSVNPKNLNIQWIIECKGCRKLNKKFIHIECTGCGLVFNDFIKFREENQTFDTTQENAPENARQVGSAIPRVPISNMCPEVSVRVPVPVFTVQVSLQKEALLRVARQPGP